MLEARFCVLADVVGWEDIVEPIVAPRRPLPILRWHLGRGVEATIGVGANELAEHALALPVAVSPGGVEEVAAEPNGFVECLTSLVVVGSGPAGESPHPVAHFAHGPAEP